MGSTRSYLEMKKQSTGFFPHVNGIRIEACLDSISSFRNIALITNDLELSIYEYRARKVNAAILVVFQTVIGPMADPNDLGIRPSLIF